MNFKMPSNQEFERRLTQMDKTQFAIKYLEFVMDVLVSEINKILNQRNSEQGQQHVQSRTIKVLPSEDNSPKSLNDFNNQVSTTILNQKAA